MSVKAVRFLKAGFIKFILKGTGLSRCRGFAASKIRHRGPSYAGMGIMVAEVRSLSGEAELPGNNFNIVV
jgi:hypothetical protein